MKQTGVFAHGLVWFGAAVSVAEIEAGIQSGPNWAALVSGHLVGGLMLFGAGLLGARTGENGMETTRGAFGRWGMRLFAVLNVIQLVGWTTVMVTQGAMAASSLTGFPVNGSILALAGLVALWVAFGLGEVRAIATIVMSLLALLAGLLTWRLLGLPRAATVGAALDFWPAFEISIAMPLSWLPLVSDYTRRTWQPVWCAVVSAGVYTIVSGWMYVVGMLLVRCGETSLTGGIVKCGLGVAGLCVIVISTMTTTFLDAYSAGESAGTLWNRLSPKPFGLAVCALGALLAVTGVVERYVDFLYLIASVFAPMAAVLLVSRFVVRRPHHVWNVGAWAVGVVTYHLAGSSPIGPTLTTLLVSVVLAALPVAAGVARTAVKMVKYALL